MYDRTQILSLLKEKKPELEKKYSISELALFGSYAREDYNKDSDIDILVDFSISVNGFHSIRHARELEGIFNEKVDLVSRKGIKPSFLPFLEKNLIHV